MLTKKHEMKLATFIVVVYNNYTDTLDCINSIAKIACKSTGIKCIIVDNSNNTDVCENINLLPSKYNFLEILRPPENVGYFGAFNFYFKHSSKTSGGFVILCNNDLIFSEDFVDALYSKVYPTDVFVVCPDVITLDGTHQNPHVSKPRTTIQRVKLDLYFSNYYIACVLQFLKGWAERIFKKSRRIASPPSYLHMGIGACYVLCHPFLSRFNNLIYPHFLYGEEAYLTRQVHDAGGKLFFDPDLIVQHKESATLSKLPKRTTYEFGRDGYWSYRNFY